MRFIITTQVKQVTGEQLWFIDAENEEEAARKFRAGEGEFISEELSVNSIEEPVIRLATPGDEEVIAGNAVTRHGISCNKVIHDREDVGHLHGPLDDGPYDVEGCAFCGRCHCAL